MKGLNKTLLIGNLGADPELRYTSAGKKVVSVGLATNETWKDRVSGEKMERTEWHRVVFFDRLAEIVSEYANKGSQIYVEGKLRTNKWQKDGVDRFTTEILVNDLQLLGRSFESPTPRPTNVLHEPKAKEKDPFDFDFDFEEPPF